MIYCVNPVTLLAWLMPVPFLGVSEDKTDRKPFWIAYGWDSGPCFRNPFNQSASALAKYFLICLYPTREYAS